MREHIPPFVYKSADRVRRVYWNVVKPETFGVKALVIHPDTPDRFLVIRQSYGDTARFTLPGGGYRPRREKPEDAMRREVREEVGLTLDADTRLLEEITSNVQGKTDHITVFSATAQSGLLRPSNEILQATWTPTDLSELPEGSPVSVFVHKALAKYTT